MLTSKKKNAAVLVYMMNYILHTWMSSLYSQYSIVLAGYSDIMEEVWFTEVDGRIVLDFLKLSFLSVTKCINIENEAVSD